MNKYEYIIVGAGIMGLTVAHTLKRLVNPSILILDKEEDVAYHASGRNSGVLHAGFYYTTDSLKAKFAVGGSRAMKAYCHSKDIKINECGKLVVAANEFEISQLHELERRGKQNGSNIEIIDEKRAEEIEPNVRTYRKALYSPETASVDPVEVCQSLKNDLKDGGVHFSFKSAYLGHQDSVIQTTQGEFEGKKFINCAGLYADIVAQDFGFGHDYTLIPFKGLYLQYTKNTTDIRTNIYPVPNLKNPFLGVHFTKTVSGTIKIGPTAIPALWRENYNMRQNFKIKELVSILQNEAELFIRNSFGFRSLALEEIKKYHKSYFVGLAEKLVKQIDPNGFTEYTKPGIRAQLLDKRRMILVQDFLIQGDMKSIHLLNAVSPAFTCAFPFSEYLIKNYILN